MFFCIHRCDFNKYTVMVLQNIGEIEEKREQEKDGLDSGHDENDELMLISKSQESDSDVDMYSSGSED